MRRGNCYAAAEALYHILGGKKAGWKPMCLRLGEGINGRIEHHWFLVRRPWKNCPDWAVQILDPSRLQFQRRGWWPPPDYSKARGCGFLTKRPSKRARELMRQLTWQQKKEKHVRAD